MSLQKKIDTYISNGMARGYPGDIPDDAPVEIFDLVPNYRAICLAILKNDMHGTTLGFSAPKTEWYSQLKRIEIEARDK